MGIMTTATDKMTQMVAGVTQGGSTRTILLASLAIGLAILGYFAYTKFFRSRAGFNANREHGSKQEPSKDANLVFFYADWCPHCKVAKPEWEALKAENEGKVINGYNVVYTDYNCATVTPEIEDLMNKYDVKGYPTVKLIKDGQVIDYDAKPTTSTMNQFLTQIL